MAAWDEISWPTTRGGNTATINCSSPTIGMSMIFDMALSIMRMNVYRVVIYYIDVCVCVRTRVRSCVCILHSSHIVYKLTCAPIHINKISEL